MKAVLLPNMDAALQALRTDIATCETLENALKGKPPQPEGKTRSGAKKDAAANASAPKRRDIEEVLSKCIDACKESRKRHREESEPPEPMDDKSLSQYARFTREFALEPYQQFLHYVPRLVNVVTVRLRPTPPASTHYPLFRTHLGSPWWLSNHSLSGPSCSVCLQLAEALPMAGSGITLPLDLASIAARCKGSFYAPRRFAAVQLAYSNPRCRVLVFHTGRLVGTGCQGAAAARLAIAHAQRQLSEEAGVNLHVRNFAVINQVGAVSLRATLNCDAGLRQNILESHTLIAAVLWGWRGGQLGSTSAVKFTPLERANLPGSVAERQLLESFSRMLPELLRFSSASHLLSKISDEMQSHHKVNRGGAGTSSDNVDPPVQKQFAVANKTRQKWGGDCTEPKKQSSLWDGWEDAANTTQNSVLNLEDEQDGDDLDLGAYGL